MAHVGEELRFRPVGVLRLAGQLPRLLGGGLELARALFDLALEPALIVLDLGPIGAEPLQHPLERAREDADLVMTGGLDLDIELSPRHGLGGGDQGVDRR